MNGRKAKALRKLIYSDKSYRDREYYKKQVKNKLVHIGKDVHSVPCYTITADTDRKTYQDLKKVI